MSAAIHSFSSARIVLTETSSGLSPRAVRIISVLTSISNVSKQHEKYNQTALAAVLVAGSLSHHATACLSLLRRAQPARSIIWNSTHRILWGTLSEASISTCRPAYHIMIRQLERAVSNDASDSWRRIAAWATGHLPTIGSGVGKALPHRYPICAISSLPTSRRE